MVRKSLGVLLLAFCVTACADESPFGPGEAFTWNANQWAVSDRPDLGELQIVATSTQVNGMGTAAIYRFDAGTMPAPVYQAAVQGWFLTHGRHCTPSNPVSPAPQTYIFDYTCWVPSTVID